MLTQKQYDLLMYIEKRLINDGVSPSFDEMKEAVELRSKSGIHRLIKGLEERGFIRRLPHRARALEIIKLPDNQHLPNLIPQDDTKQSARTNKGFALNVIDGNFGNILNVASTPPDSMQLPLYGKIAAGTPIEALRDQSSMIEVPPSMLGSGDHYALQVDGESMIEAGIEDGDTVIIQRCDTAVNGSIVVALVDENEVTLKRIRRKGNSIALEPANKTYETRIFGPDQVKVQGRLVGLLRLY